MNKQENIMTDLERWETLYFDMEIGYEVIVNVENTILRTGDGNNVTGYMGFYTDIVFDNDEKFIQMGAYE